MLTVEHLPNLKYKLNKELQKRRIALARNELQRAYELDEIIRNLKAQILELKEQIWKK